MAYDMDDHGRAQRYYITALRAAHAADDRPLGANILSCMARQASDLAQPRESVTLIETALTGLQQRSARSAPRLRAMLHDNLAYAHAGLGDARAARRAIGQAWEALAHESDDDLPQLSFMSPSVLKSDSGQQLLQLGKPSAAEPLIEEGIGALDSSMVRSRQFWTCALAEARVRSGKLDEAAHAGQQALDVTPGLNSARSVARVRSLCGDMRPHQDVPAVREFLERAREIVA
jgi:ATP/maltotriose-dependent transcriptional regulator MalT